MRDINIKIDREEIATIISKNLDLMVSEKNKKGIIINYPMVQNIADCVLCYMLGLFDEIEQVNFDSISTKNKEITK